MKALPWFRMYHEALDDEKLRLVACEDRWHFVALLCCKAKGILDEGGVLLRRKLAVKLGLSTNELDEVARRLAEVGLIDKDTFQPLAWDVRQMQSDKDLTNAERQKRYREGHKAPATHSNALRNAPVTRRDTDTDTDTDKEKKSASAPTLDISASLLSDYLIVRKAKHAGPLTRTVLAGLQREADKAGITLTQAVTACCEFGWQGFRADWYTDRTAQKPAAMTASRRTPSPETFAERDAANKRRDWEAMTGRVWPTDNLPSASAAPFVIDVPANELRRIS